MNNTENTKVEQEDWVDESVPEKTTPKKKVKANGKKKAVQKVKAPQKVKGKVLKTGKKSKKKYNSKKNDESKKITVNFKIFPKEARAIKLKAKELTNGNVTQMVRMAVLAWKPAKKTLEGIRKSTRA